MSQNPFSDNPYLAPSQPRYQAALIPPEEMRKRSLAKVGGPAILMMIYGSLVVFGSLMLLLIPLSVTGEPDFAFMLIFCIVAAAIGTAIGLFTIVTAVWMKRLQGWGWALASVILSFIVGLLACPLFMVVGIWPLVALLDSDVRASFDQPIGSNPFQQ